jgi:glutamate carboxypeptidase
MPDAAPRPSVRWRGVDDWVRSEAADMAARAERELEALVAVSSPSGDVHGAEEAAAIIAALVPLEASVERPPCSSPDHAPDVEARLTGEGSGRVLLLGHLDTVVPHTGHRPLVRDGERLIGSGAVDMKGGVVLALGALRALARLPHAFAEAALLCVTDEEWRRTPFAHTARYAGWDACLCFEAGDRGPDGHDAVVVRRKAAGTLRVEASGTAAHSGSAPEKGRNALLALAAAAEHVAARHAPTGPDRLTAVPTIVRSGDAFNVVPAAGELYCDLRADSLEALRAVIDTVPSDVRGAALRTELVREWPGMDARAATAGLLRRAAERLGRPLLAGERGGASDASHLAGLIPLTVDGLGPRGGRAHSPGEYVLAPSLRERAEVALAVLGAAVEP